MTSEPRIIVKFRSDVTIPYEDNAERLFPAPISLLWQQLQSQFPGAGLSLNRLIRVQTGEQLADLLNTVRARSGQEPPNLLSVMAIDVAGFVNRPALVGALRALPFVEYAYEETRLVQASVDPSNDPFAPAQGYLLPAPFGIDAFFAWSLPGADGDGIKFLDIERGWNLAHEDLAGAGVTQLNQSVPGNESQQHALELCWLRTTIKELSASRPRSRGR